MKDSVDDVQRIKWVKHNFNSQTRKLNVSGQPIQHIQDLHSREDIEEDLAEQNFPVINPEWLLSWTLNSGAHYGN